MQKIPKHLVARFKTLVEQRMNARTDGNLRLEREVLDQWGNLERVVGRKVSPLEVFLDCRKAAA